jgi:hypothetical protein
VNLKHDRGAWISGFLQTALRIKAGAIGDGTSKNKKEQSINTLRLTECASLGFYLWPLCKKQSTFGTTSVEQTPHAKNP